MQNKILPVYLENSFEKIYGNFGYRFAALFLDGFIVAPLTLIVMYANSMNLYNHYVTFPISQLIMLAYHVYLPVRFGATPGKQIMGLKILKLNGTPISYKESFLRYVLLFSVSLFTGILLLVAVSYADASLFNDLSWTKQQNYLQSFSGYWNFISVGVIYLVYFGSFIYFMLDDRNRSLNDLIAGTVVVKSHLIIDVEEWVEQNEKEVTN